MSRQSVVQSHLEVLMQELLEVEELKVTEIDADPGLYEALNLCGSPRSSCLRCGAVQGQNANCSAGHQRSRRFLEALVRLLS